MALYDSAGFEIGNVLDRRAYPTARSKRTGPPPPGSQAQAGQGLAGLAPPQSRILTFNVSCNAGVRTTASSTRIVGPALLLELHASTSVATFGAFSLELGVAPNAVAEQDVALTTAKQWRSITERISQNSVAENANRVGFGAAPTASGIPRGFGKLNYIVVDNEFFLTFSVVSTGAAGSAIAGHLALLQALTSDQLVALLG